MLCYIKIKDYILINNFESELKDGFTTIIGETGAGKSLILSAINLACGKRVDFDVEKNIKKKAEIVLSFNISKNTLAKKALKKITGKDSDVCTIKRFINKNGKSSTYINGESVKLKDVSYISSFLIDIFSQNNTTKIFNQNNQINAYDTYSGCFNLQVELSRISTEYKRLKKSIDEWEARKKETEEKMGLLNYQMEEFEQLSLGSDEYKKLEEEFDLIENSKEYKQNSSEIISIINEEEIGLNSLLSKVSKKLSNMNEERDIIKDSISSIIDIKSILSDLEKNIENEFNNYDFDEERYFSIENRLSEINSVAKKNNVLPDDLYMLIEEKTEEHNNFKSDDFNIDGAKEDLRNLKVEWLEIAKELTDKRLDSKDKFIKEVESRLSELKMSESKIDIEFKDYSYEINEYGNEVPIIKISTNLGQDYYDLEIVMSGGEASRFSLVLQTLIKRNGRTIIFDEIDAGIGGLTGHNVGEYMKKISESTQVLSITHLAQVVMHSENQFLVRKNPKNGENITNIIIEPLNETKLIYEIARMMGHDIVNKKIKEQIRKQIEVKRNA